MKRNYVYSDFNPQLKNDGLGNVKTFFDMDAIEQSIKNIMLTVQNERVRNPIGSSLVQYLFRPMNADTVRDIRNEIKRLITRWEPRVTLTRLEVSPNYDQNYYDLEMSFRVKSLGNVQRNFSTKIRSLTGN
jgi:phage baseplate assembly protein W